MFEIFLKGGPLMWPILACSFVMAVIIIERIIYMSGADQDISVIFKAVKDKLMAKKYEDALAICEGFKSPVAPVISACIKMRKTPKADKEELIQSIGSKELRKYDKNLRGLAIIANISPLIGLLGTVTGLIKSFIKIQELGGRVDASILAGGIWEALITTAAGLSVAIIAVIFYHYFEGKVEKVSNQMKDSVRFMNEWLKVGELKIGKKEAEILEDIEYGI